MTDTAQVPLKAETLAQKTVAEIRERMAELDLQVAGIDEEIAQINGLMMGNWRHTAQNPEQTERIAEDLEKAHRRRKLLQQVREKAEGDLRIAERQVVLDRFAERRGEFEAIMKQRTKRAHDVIATVEMLAAAIEEIHQLGRDAIRLFSTDASDGGVSFTEALRTINRVHAQGHIDLLMSAKLERGLWGSDVDQRPGPNFRSDYASRIDAERTALLVELGTAARRVGEGDAL